MVGVPMTYKSKREIDDNRPRVYAPLSGVKGYNQVPFYINQQFPRPANKCGPAAAFSMLTIYKHVSFTGMDFVNAEWGSTGTDPNLGPFGTTAGRIEEIIKKYGGTPHFHKEEDSTQAAVNSLIGSLRSYSPACVLLDLAAGGSEVTKSWIAGHWVVAYAYDSAQVYLTNYGPMGWEPFKKCFAKTWLTNDGGMGNAYYTVT